MGPMLPGDKKDFTYASSVIIAMGENRSQADQELKAVIPEEAWESITAFPAGLDLLILVFIDPGDIALFSKEIRPEFIE